MVIFPVLVTFFRRGGLAALALAVLLPGCSMPATPPPGAPAVAGTRDVLVLAASPTLQDSGLLAAILPDFERKTGITVRVLAVDNGQALAIAAAGDADVALVHDPEREEALVAAGQAAGRFGVLYSDLLLVGPASDPAGVQGAPTLAEALGRIAAAQAAFVSRGDESAAHLQELDLWQAAGVVPPAGAWYVSAGQDTGATLDLAGQQQAYALSDRAAYVLRRHSGLDLIILFEQTDAPSNRYSVLPVSPDRGRDANLGGAIAFVNWLTSHETQARIADYGIAAYGQALFFPAAVAP